ncbi:hypothetical protein ACH4ND_25220 [Streptomyces sp. NPDC017179]|uniref:hypothetical protein n=1 Tax=Streptomyces sp. NPDC017179 TaxID=3364979 RepID=UPI0037965BF0
MPRINIFACLRWSRIRRCRSASLIASSVHLLPERPEGRHRDLPADRGDVHHPATASVQGRQDGLGEREVTPTAVAAAPWLAVTLLRAVKER